MECPEGNFCFKKESFGLWILLSLVIFIILYYNMSKKIEKNLILKEKHLENKKKIENLERHIEELKSALTNTSNSKIKKTIENDIKRFEEEKELYYKRIGDPLEVPNRTYEFTRGIYNKVQEYQPREMVNIPTRGVPTDFQPLGVLTNVDNKKTPNILQLFGRPLWIGSNKWQYYTSSDNYQSIKIQIINKRQECLSDLGCEELYLGDIVHVPAYGMDFRVDLYRIDKPKYIPYLV